MFDFFTAAFPWLILGIAVIVITIFHNRPHHGHKTYITEGLCIGICLGVALGCISVIKIATGIALGMLIGEIIGYNMYKE